MGCYAVQGLTLKHQKVALVATILYMYEVVLKPMRRSRLIKMTTKWKMIVGKSSTKGVRCLLRCLIRILYSTDSNTFLYIRFRTWRLRVTLLLLDVVSQLEILFGGVQIQVWSAFSRDITNLGLILRAIYYILFHGIFRKKVEWVYKNTLSMGDM